MHMNKATKAHSHTHTKKKHIPKDRKKNLQDSNSDQIYSVKNRYRKGYSSSL